VPSTLDSQLIAAAWKNDVAGAKRLIAAGADVNAVDDTVQSAFLIAASEGYLELLDLTLAHGADVRSLDSYHGTALIRAAERGHTAVVGRLIKAGVAVNHVNNLGWTALHEAVLLGKGTPQYVDTVRLLIAGGADRAKPAVSDGATPVQAAKDRGPAGERGHVDYVRRVVQTKIDVNHVNNLGWTALLEAIILGKGTQQWQEIVKILVGAGADPNLADADGVSPLRHAESRGYDEIAKTLRAAGAR